MNVDRKAAEQAVRSFLTALGLDPDSDPELRRTPALVAEAFETDLLAGYSTDISKLVQGEASPLDAASPRGAVVLRGIDVATMCPHHLLPAMGTATVAYLPGRSLVGLGTLARLVDAFARRLTLQEAIGEGVVQALVEHAGARGAFCRIELRHACVAIRGARQAHATAVTFAQKGESIPEVRGSEGDSW
jgi:GTP cyclohydrolase I